MDQNSLPRELISQVIFRIEENSSRIIQCLYELDENDIWKKPNDSSNSVGNLVLHLCGNITQYILAALGGKKDTRTRYLEFSISPGYSREQLKEILTGTVTESVHVIQNLPSVDLVRMMQVQGFNLSGTGILIHVAEHFSYHTGQIAFWTKLLKDKDLGFYAGIDLG